MKNNQSIISRAKFYGIRIFGIALIIFVVLDIALIKFQNKDFSWEQLFSKENIGFAVLLAFIAAALSIITTNKKDND